MDDPPRTTGRRDTLLALATALDRQTHVLLARPDLTWPQLHSELQWAGGEWPALLDRERDRRRTATWARPWLRTAIPTTESPALLRTLRGHTDRVNDCAAAPDGTFVVSAGDDRSVRLWDPRSGAGLLTLSGHTAPVLTCAVAPDSSYVVSGGVDATLRLWHPRTGAELHRDETGQQIRWCAVSATGLVAHDAGGPTVRLWDPARRAEVRRLEGQHLILDGTFSPDGSLLLTTHADGTVTLWDVRSGSALVTRRGHGDEAVAAMERAGHFPSAPIVRRVQAAAFAPDGRTVVTGGHDNTLRWWQVPSGEPLRTVHGEASHDVTCCAFAPDGSALVTSSFSGHDLTVWDPESGTPLGILAGHADAVNACAVLPDGSAVVSASADHTLKVWDHRAATPGSTSPPRPGTTIRGTSGVAWWPDGSAVLAARGDGRLTVHDPDSLAERRALPVLQQAPDGSWYDDSLGGAGGCAVAPDGSFVLATGFSHLTLLDPADGRVLLQVGQARDMFSAGAIAPDGLTFLGAGEEHPPGMYFVRQFRVSDGALVHEFLGHTDLPTCLAVSPDGQWAVSGARDKTLRFWDLRDRSAIRCVEGFPAWPHRCAISPTGDLVAVGDLRGSLSLWEVASGQCRWTIPAHPATITGCTFLDGGRIVTVSDDPSLAVWSVRRGRELTRIYLPAPLDSVAAAPRAPVLVCGDDTGGVQRVTVEDPVDAARRPADLHRPGP